MGYFYSNCINSSGFKINNISGIKDIKAGVNHLAILKNDGSVYILGHKYWIDESLEQDMGVLEPYKISELSDVKEIASGKEFILALLEDGSVMALGNNDLTVGTGDPKITKLLKSKNDN